MISLSGIVHFLHTSKQVKLQRLQNKAIRIITNSNMHSPITPKFHNLAILKIFELYDLEIAKIMHQHSKQALSSSLAPFNKVSNIHSCNTRSVVHNNLYLPKFSTNRCQNSFQYQGVKIWNSIPCDLRNQSYSKFKSNYKKILLNSYLLIWSEVYKQNAHIQTSRLICYFFLSIFRRCIPTSLMGGCLTRRPLPVICSLPASIKTADGSMYSFIYLRFFLPMCYVVWLD